MSLYNTNTLTAQSYDLVNPTNSNPAPFTATGGDSDTVYRGHHTAPTPQPAMKGGYSYKKPRRSSRPRSLKRTKKQQSISSVSSVIGMDVSYRGRSGGTKKRRASINSYPKRNRMVGMTLASGRTGGTRRRRRRESRRSGKRRLAGGMSAFPTSYSTPANIGGMSALANPAPYGLNYS